MYLWMETVTMTAVQHLLERTQPADGDAALLERFASQGDGEAFRLLVDRHAGMVYAACRRILGDCHGAEDAAQAAFLLLAKKACSLRQDVVLAGWLYKTAIFAAREAKRGRAIRARHEREAVVMRLRRAGRRHAGEARRDGPVRGRRETDRER